MRMHQDLFGPVSAYGNAFAGIQLLAVGIRNVIDHAPQQRSGIGNGVGGAVIRASAMGKHKTVFRQAGFENEARIRATIRCLYALLIHI